MAAAHRGRDADVPAYLRLMGATVGRDVWCETLTSPSSTPSQLGDGCAVNRNAVVETHLFHDRLMRIGPADPRPRSDPRPAAAMLPDTTHRRPLQRRWPFGRDARRAAAARHPLARAPVLAAYARPRRPHRRSARWSSCSTARRAPATRQTQTPGARARQRHAVRCFATRSYRYPYALSPGTPHPVGIDIERVEPCDPASLPRSAPAETDRLVALETPTNTSLALVKQRGARKGARRRARLRPATARLADLLAGWPRGLLASI